MHLTLTLIQVFKMLTLHKLKQLLSTIYSDLICVCLIHQECLQDYNKKLNVIINQLNIKKAFKAPKIHVICTTNQL